MRVRLKANKQDYVEAKSSSVWFLLLSVAFTTLYFKTESTDPFNTYKLIVILLSAGWLLGHLIDYFRIHTHESNLKFLKITIFAFIFIFSMGISLSFTDVFIIGLIGDNQRRNGFLAYLMLIVIFLYAARSINLKYAVRVMKVMIIAGIILSSYGLLQINGKDFFEWNNPYNSMISTLGNPNFASSMLAIVTLVSAFSLFLKNFATIFKALAVIVIIMSVYSIIKSESRQGILVIAFGLLFYICIYAYTYNLKLKVLTITTSMIVAIIAVLGMLRIGPLSSILYKDSVSVRGFYWRSGIEMFLDKPLTGVGLDRYGAYFKEFREAEYPLRYGWKLTSSNAHNTFIQFFATGGIFVGISYLLLLLVILICGIKLAKRLEGDNRKIILTILSSWVGFQAQSLISIDNIGIAVWGWLLGGSILGIYLSNFSTTKLDPPKLVKNKSLVKIQIFQPILSTMLVIPLATVSFFLNRFEYDSYVHRGLVLSQPPINKQLVVEYSNKILNNPLADPSYKFQAAISFVNIDLPAESYSQVMKLYKLDSKNLEVLNWLSEYESFNKNFSNAIKFRTQIAKYDPWNAENLLKLGELYKTTGDLEKSKEMLEKILSFAASNDIATSARESLG
jgi:O-antigen ligase